MALAEGNSKTLRGHILRDLKRIYSYNKYFFLNSYDHTSEDVDPFQGFINERGGWVGFIVFVGIVLSLVCSCVCKNRKEEIHEVVE